MLAEGRLRDLQRHLERTRQKHEEIRRQNTALEELIRRMEGIAAPGGN
jgi:septal ring factor EnvC (AmiA/AmiB activator)